MAPVIVSGRGPYLFDSDGRKYINLAESINIFGHRDPGILSEIRRYLRSGHLHYPLTVSPSPAAAELEDALRGLTGIKDGRVIFSSSGSEACDVALSVLSDIGPVVTLSGGYHGLTGAFLRKDEVDIARYGSRFVLPFPGSPSVIEDLRGLVRKGAKSILLEVLQAEGGMREVYEGFLKDIRSEFPDLIVAVDEVYTGVGKTARLFAYQWHHVVPDVIILGKAIGGGLPLGVTFFRGDLLERSATARRYRNGALGSSSGNRLALHLALYVLRRASSASFLDEVAEKGRAFRETLGKELSSRVRGRGLVLGIWIEPDGLEPAILRALEEGLFVGRMGDVLRVTPPLTIPRNLLIRAAKKLRKIISSLG